MQLSEYDSAANTMNISISKNEEHLQARDLTALTIFSAHKIQDSFHKIHSQVFALDPRSVGFRDNLPLAGCNALISLLSAKQRYEPRIQHDPRC